MFFRIFLLLSVIFSVAFAAPNGGGENSKVEVSKSEIQKNGCPQVPIGVAVNKADMNGLSGCDACVQVSFKNGNTVSGIQEIPVAGNCEDCAQGTLRFPPGSSVVENGMSWKVVKCSSKGQK